MPEKEAAQTKLVFYDPADVRIGHLPTVGRIRGAGPGFAP